MPYLLATPYAQAVPHVLGNVSLPVNVYPTGGPFYPAQSLTGKIVLRENPFYKGARHAHFGEIDILYNPDLVAVRDAIEQGTVDYANVNLLSPPDQDALAAKYGVHRGRFQVHPSAETDYVALNTLRSVFGQPRLRRAASQVIDREQLAKFNGRFAASPADHILPDTLSAIAQRTVYDHSSANLPAAMKLAEGHCGDLNVYTTNGPTGMAYGQAVTAGLNGIGCRANLLAFTPFEYGQRVDTRGQPYDAALFRTSRFFDFGDPLNFMANVMDPARRPPHGPNYSNVAERGIKRHLQAMRDFYAGGMSDAEILDFLRKRNAKISKFESAELSERPPWVTIDNPNDREFFSKSLRPSSLVYHSITGGADYVKMAPR
jgi:ABC-type transport system substrate-binding protein